MLRFDNRVSIKPISRFPQPCRVLLSLFGLPSDYATWVNDPTVQSVAPRLEEARRGLLDGYLVFDAGGTSIQYEIERNYVPAGSLSVAIGTRRLNPRSWPAPMDAAPLLDHLFFTSFE